jgi:hypothetical protein
MAQNSRESEAFLLGAQFLTVCLVSALSQAGMGSQVQVETCGALPPHTAWETHMHAFVRMVWGLCGPRPHSPIVTPCVPAAHSLQQQKTKTAVQCHSRNLTPA